MYLRSWDRSEGISCMQPTLHHSTAPKESQRSTPKSVLRCYAFGYVCMLHLKNESCMWKREDPIPEGPPLWMGASQLSFTEFQARFRPHNSSVPTSSLTMSQEGQEGRSASGRESSESSSCGGLAWWPCPRRCLLCKPYGYGSRLTINNGEW